MAFGKRTDDVIGSVPNKPKLTKYVMMSDLHSESTPTEEKIVKQLELKKEDLFNNFENNEDIHFLSFESDGFIPIEDDFSIMKKFFLDSINDFYIPISNENQDYEDFLFTPLSKSNLINCLTYIDPLNLYLTIGFFESKRFRGPLFFVPIIIANNFIKRDYNKEIKFNYLLKSELEYEENILLPDINLNVEEYINELKKFSNFKISDKSFVGNFYFRNLLIYNDLNLSNWYNSYDKFRSFLKNEHIYSIDEFKNLNNEIAKKWPSLDLNYQKDFKMKGADKLITNLLSEGNSILYISNYYSKNEVKKSLTNKYLNSLILDFDYNLDKYSIFNDVGEVFFNFDDKKNISMLTEKKIFNKNMFNILKNTYSGLNLTPFEIKEKRDEFSQYDYDLDLEINESLLNDIENINEEIKDISKNTNLINIVVNSNDSNFSNDEFEKFIFVHDSIRFDIFDFEKINQKLNKKYGLKIFDNLVLPQYLENINLITEESKYLIKEDYDKINEFLKVNHDYQNLKNDGSNVFTKKINKYTNDIVNQKDKLEHFNDKIDEIKSLVEYLDISNSSFDESIENLSLLFNHPKIIENEDELYDIVKVIDEYKTEKDFDGHLIDQLKQFWDENDEINEMLNEYNQYLNNNSETLILYNDINNLSKLFDDFGFNFKTLNEYFSLKNRLSLFENAEYVENKSFFELNGYLKEFLKTYDDSLKNYLENVFSQLRDIFNDIKDILHNRYSVSYKEDLFNNITEILEIQKNLGFNFDNFKELDDNEEFIKYLNNNPNFDFHFDNEYLVENFEKINEFNIPETIQDYIDFRINDYVSIIEDILDLAEEYLKDNYDWIYIKRGIEKIIEIKDKIGINYNSINEFINNEEILDILIQNPKLNYTIEDYELYLNINKICKEYGIDDIDELLNSLNNKNEDYLKSINEEIKPILNEEYDLKFIKDKINEINGIINNLSELLNCIKIDKFNEIDDFIKNIQILKHNPAFIENYDDFDSYIETINYLKNPSFLDEEFLTECSLKLVDFNDMPFENKISELRNLIDICYENDTSIYLLNTKKDFNNLMEKINNLNIDCKIINNLDLDECIDSLKPKYSLVHESHKKKDKKFRDTSREKNPDNIEKSILKKIDSSINPYPRSINYDLKSKNYNLNKDTKENYLFNGNDNNEIYNYLKNKNVSKEDIINDLTLLKEYLDNFNDLYDKISEYVHSNLKNIKEFTDYEELYYNKIEKILESACPNSFRGLESNIDDLKNEFENNKYFTQLVDTGFFKDASFEYNSFDEINKQTDILKKSKNELIDLCNNSDFNLDDTFENILNYINYLLNDIKIFKDSNDKILELNYLNEYISEDLLFKFNNLNKNISKLSNLDNQFIKKYFKEHYGLKVKENIKLVDKFNNLIKNNIFTDNTIKFLENTPQGDIENEIIQLKININSVYLNLVKKDLNLDDEKLPLILNKINSIINFNLKFKNEIDENSYLLNLINFDNYGLYARKFISFISEYNSQISLSNQCEIFKEIVSELDSINEIHNDEDYKNTLFKFDGNQINNELLKLKNNLIYNNLAKLGKIKGQIPKSTKDLIHLIDETKKIINENDYNVTFDELIKDNENIKVELNEFDDKFDEILEKINDDALIFLDIIPDIENLFKEYSIPLNKKFINFNKDLSQNLDLIRLCSSLDENLFELSKTELNGYTSNMDINNEFSNLIDSNIFSKSVCQVYNNENYEDKLEEMENLSLKIASSVSKHDLDKNILNIVNSDIKKINDDYSKIIELKEMNSNDSKELINNYFVILDRINKLYKNKPFITDYALDILKINEKLDKLSRLYNLEVELQNNEELIEKHFSEILNSPDLINDLYEKIELDLEFTKCYNDNIFSDITVKNSESLQPIDLSFENSILKLYDSNDYQEIYDKNKVLIDEITNFKNDVTKQREFLINVNELLKNEDLDNLLKLDINSKLDEYESRLADLSDINKKYFADSDDIITELKNHIAYTEIIENEIFDDEKLIKSNLKDISEELNELNKIYFSLLNKVYRVSEFYLKNPYFDINQNSFSYEMSFETLKNNLNIFEKDLNDINKRNNIHPIVISLIHQMYEQNIEFSKMEGVFNYNVYNTILTKFYDDFPEIEGKNLDYVRYKKEIDKIDKQINKNRFNQVLTEIYGNIHENINNESILTQKETLNQIITNKTMGTIKETLNEFKEYILNVKPIFMMDISQFYEYISNEYESLFDYVILDKNFEFEELDILALYLRSKNKIIDLR